MPYIYALVNQKGGVGKTTTSINLAASFAAMKRKVMLIDLDPQGNATMGSGIDKRGALHTVYHVLLGLSELATARLRSDSGGYDLLPANRELAGAEIELVGIERRELRLKEALAGISADYDYILIDCPPSLSLLTINGLVAADAVLIPMQCEYYALEGLSDLVQTVKKVRAHLNPSLEIEGLLRTMYDPRNTLAQNVAAAAPGAAPPTVAVAPPVPPLETPAPAPAPSLRADMAPAQRYYPPGRDTRSRWAARAARRGRWKMGRRGMDHSKRIHNAQRHRYLPAPAALPDGCVL
mgnify:CR=1 FL=1